MTFLDVLYDNVSAPRGCLQYYTGIGGTIKSYNFYFPTDPLNVRQLANMDYNICIRQAEGFCSVCYTQCNDPSSNRFTSCRLTLRHL
jgi:hypothetical protein